MEFDYIIVGAGSAGCVLANRLSKPGLSKPGSGGGQVNRVLLVEAGPEDKALSLKMPAAVLTNLNSTTHNWAYKGEPEPQLNGKQLKHDRGKTLGGSSSINGMVFIRGHAQDFERWRQSGCEGWSYADVLPYFKRMESYDGGADEYRGGSGPLRVHRPVPENPLALAFINAGVQAGYESTDDICGYRQEGFGLLDRSVYKGERWSTSRAYLDPVKHRNNLTIVTAAHVQQVVLQGKTATGIVYRDSGGSLVNAVATKEVILSAGAVGSPHLLMLSGIGPADQLRSLGIDVVTDLAGVGQNLNDHPDFVLKYKCLQPVSLWPQTKGIGRIAAGLKWFVSRRGIVGSNHFDVVACLRSGPAADYPDLQLTISPIAVDDETWAPLPEHAFQIHVGLMQAYSRGRIELRSADAATSPSILVNYLQDPRDREMMRSGIRIARQLVGQTAFKTLCGKEIYPGAKVQTDSQLDECLSSNTASQWHLSGTARMGLSTDHGAVVNAVGSVHGIHGLRVVDASIMPVVTNGNTNSPTIMIAEKLSDAILGNTPLPRIEADVWDNVPRVSSQGS